MNIKQQRLNSLFSKEISDIIVFELKDPNVGMVSITQTSISNDLSYAKIYVSIIDKKQKKESLNALNRAKGFIRTELAKRIKIRKIPELTFIYDDSLDKAQRIKDILKRVNKEEQDA